MTNEPSWDEIFSAQPTTDAASGKKRPVPPRTAAGGFAPTAEPAPQPAPAAQQAPSPAAPPLTRRELREREAAREGRLPPPRSTFAEVSGSEGPPRRPKKKRSLGWLWALIIIIVLAAAGGAAVWTLFEPQVRELLGMQLPTDYEGDGNGTEVDVVIASGDSGTAIAKTLEKDGVVLTSKAFYDTVIAQPESPNFQPGTYSLEGHMSAAAALAALVDPDNRVVSTVLIPEGKTLAQVLTILAEKTGQPLADFEAAAKDPAAFGIPAGAPSLEGYLFPAKYTFDPGLTPKKILQTLVDRMNQSLTAAGVSDADALKVLTLASIIQKEGGKAEDFPMVSRVFTNRLAAGMPLQSDATVTYGTGGTSIFTTQAERDDATNKYNTYANKGLPIGPISAPGDAAIEAAVKPVAGDWLYFVLVNGETGETKFSTTLAEHEKGVAQFQQWLKDHPDYKTGG